MKKEKKNFRERKWITGLLSIPRTSNGSERGTRMSVPRRDRKEYGSYSC